MEHSVKCKSGLVDEKCRLCGVRNLIAGLLILGVLAFLSIVTLGCAHTPRSHPTLTPAPRVILTSNKQIIQPGEPVIVTALLRGDPWLNHEQDWLCMLREWTVLERAKTLLEGTRADEPCGEQSITRHWDKTYTDFSTPGMSYTVRFALYDRRGALIDRESITINVAGEI